MTIGCLHFQIEKSNYALQCPCSQVLAPVPLFNVGTVMKIYELTGLDRNGKDVPVKQPRIDLDLCIGCGICETKCPVRGQPVIYVISTGESRSRDNQLLL